MKPVGSGTERPLHVCFFPGELQLGGVGRNTLNLAAELLGRGIRVDFFLSRRAGVYVSMIPDGVRTIEGGGKVSNSLPHLVRYLRRERPDILIPARSHINVVALLAKRMARVSTKVVVTERTTTAMMNDVTPRNSVRRTLVNMGCRLLYPGADRVVAVSGAVADDLVRRIGLSRERIEVIHNPVVGKRIDDLAQEDPEDPWIGATASPIVVGVGRLTRQKDFPTLLRAFAEVRSERHLRLVLLGEGEDRKMLEELSRELDIESDVHMPGYVDNPYAYLARSDLFVLSSRWEGLPTVLIEAMATGTPVVSTDCPGGSREILAGGEFGALVPMGDVSKMAEAIREALDHPLTSDRLRERAWDFSATRAADRYLVISRPNGQ